MKKLLVIGHIWPEPSSTAAGTRMLQLLELFKDKDYQIHFASAAQPTEYSENLELLDFKQWSIQLNDDRFDKLLMELQPGVVLYDRFITEEQYGWRVAESCPEAMTILDTEDLHFLREARRAAVKNQLDWSDDMLYSKLAQREIAAMLRVDYSLIISEHEMRILRDHFAIRKERLIYLPFLLEANKFPKNAEKPSFEDRAHFMMIGNVMHAPNQDAIIYAKQAIWPLIRKVLPKAELHIYGSYHSEKTHQYHNAREGFLIKGRATDAIKTLQDYRVLLAPLRFGAGLKGKIFDALQAGTPAAMTGIAAEAMFDDRVYGCVEDLPDLLAKKAVALYENKSDWEAVQKLNRQILKNRYDKVLHTRRLSKYLEHPSPFSTEPSHDLKSFTEQMVVSQSRARLKFMSRWIFLKNHG